MRRSIVLGTAGMLLMSEGTALNASGGGGAPDGLHLVPMDEIRVPVVEGSRADGTLQLKLVLVAKDSASAEGATADLPQLRAASVAAALEFARLYASPMLPVDVKRLTDDMTAAIHHQDARIGRVLVVEVMARRA